MGKLRIIVVSKEHPLASEAVKVLLPTQIALVFMVKSPFPQTYVYPLIPGVPPVTHCPEAKPLQESAHVGELITKGSLGSKGLKTVTGLGSVIVILLI